MVLISMEVCGQEQFMTGNSWVYALRRFEFNYSPSTTVTIVKTISIVSASTRSDGSVDFTAVVKDSGKIQRQDMDTACKCIKETASDSLLVDTVTCIARLDSCGTIIPQCGNKTGMDVLNDIETPRNCGRYWCCIDTGYSYFNDNRNSYRVIYVGMGDSQYFIKEIGLLSYETRTTSGAHYIFENSARLLRFNDISFSREMIDSMKMKKSVRARPAEKTGRSFSSYTVKRAGDRLTVYGTSGAAAPSEIVLLDSRGRRLGKGRPEPAAGSRVFSFPAGAIHVGLAFVAVRDKNGLSAIPVPPR
jgi:hypothetical protein